MKIVLTIIGGLLILFMVLFFFCACRLSSESSRHEETLFQEWYASHTEDPERKD